MDDNKNFIEGEKIEKVNNTAKPNETSSFSGCNNKSNYRPVSEFTVKSKKESNSGFGKTVLTPFLFRCIRWCFGYWYLLWST